MLSHLTSNLHGPRTVTLTKPRVGNAVVCPYSASLYSGWVIDWDEDACNALPGFEATLTGGDGDAIQFRKRRFNLYISIEHDK